MRVLIAAPHPGMATETEGMMQRVADIDRFLRATLPDAQLDYLQISYRQSAVRLEDKETRSFQYTYNIFVERSSIQKLIDTYDVVYIHSLYNYRNLWPFLKGSRHLVIADLHGVVPEEERFSGHRIRGAALERLEGAWLERAQVIVAVTQRMIEHFQAKYDFTRGDAKNYILLPIFDEALLPGNIERVLNDKEDLAVYAGGLQPWQNVPLVAGAIPRLLRQGFVTECYFPAYRKDEREQQAIGAVERAGGRVGTLPRSELFGRYRQARLGFLLREDMTINRVSSPTKLNEYLAFGIVPILLQPRVGDFAALGYHHLRFDDLMVGNVPQLQQLRDMALQNLERYRIQWKQSTSGRARLQQVIEAGP